MNFINVAIPANGRSTQLPFTRPFTKEQGFIPTEPNATPVVKFETFTNSTYLSILVGALLKIEERTIKVEPVLRRCNAWFEIMSKERGRHKKSISFSKVWQDPQILICFWPAPTGHAEAMSSGNFITLSEKLFNRTDAVVRIAGALIHEMAHNAGASELTKDAEESLGFCGFDDVRTPGLVG